MRHEPHATPIPTQASQIPMNRRWLALIAFVAMLLVLLPIVLLALVGRRPDAASAPAMTVRSTAPNASSGEVVFADTRWPDDAVWYRIGRDLRMFPPHLEVGTLVAGVTRDVVLETTDNPAPDAILPQRAVLGVGGGVVVTIEDDGHRSMMRAIEGASGDKHELLESADVILDGVLAIDGRLVYFVTADRQSGELVSVWRLAVREPGAPEPIDGLAAMPAIRLAAVSRHATRMLLSADGSTLGLYRCDFMDCFLRTARADDGTPVGEVPIERGWVDPIAMTDKVALLSPIVPDGPERFGRVVDLVSGEQWRVPVEGWPTTGEAAIDTDRGQLLAVQSAGFWVPPESPDGEFEQPAIDLIDPVSLEIVARHAPALSALRIVPLDSYDVGVDLPPGWMLVVGSVPGERRLDAYAMDVADGGLVPLPAVGEFFVQG
jgi:hypothetical protein